MTDHQQHPTIAPPLGLVRQWITEARSQDYCSIAEQVAYRTAQWVCEQCGKADEAQLQKARDEELEACIAWFDRNIPGYELVADRLRTARRPEPSDKEQAIKLLECYGTSGVQLTADQCNKILRALGDSND